MAERKKRKLLGILGGLGPMSSVYFYRMLTEHTKAESDQEHIDLVLSSRASTPDRTAFITGRSDADPLSVMTADARRLEAFGAELLAIPCNTAHYFYEEIQRSVNIPVVSIIAETVAHLKRNGIKTAGILATEGTVCTNTYQGMCEAAGLAWAIPDADGQRAVTDVIYNTVKRGVTPSPDSPAASAFMKAADALAAKGCERLILGCTELSVFAGAIGRRDIFTDALEVLAYRIIVECGAEPVGFGAAFSE